MNYEPSNLKTFISLLETHHQRHPWYGWSRHSSSRGIFLTFSTLVEGFQIILAYHDYSHEKPTYPFAVHGRRGLNRTRDVTWIEITIHDLSARFGRRTILNKEAILPNDSLYPKLEKIFGSIREKGTLLNPAETTSLSVEQALQGVCDSLQKS